jgi:hypothetical protein
MHSTETLASIAHRANADGGKGIDVWRLTTAGVTNLIDAPWHIDAGGKKKGRPVESNELYESNQRLRRDYETLASCGTSPISIRRVITTLHDDSLDANVDP